MVRPRLRIAIVGAGIAGLSTAIVLARSQHHVTVFEKAPTLSEIGAGINLTPNAIHVLKHLGLFERLQKDAVEYKVASLLSYHHGHTLASISVDDNVTFRNPDMVIHRVDLQLILADEAARQGVIIKFGADILEIHSCPMHDPIIQLSDGTITQWDLVIGADGERSFVRQAALKQNVKLRDSGEHVFRMTLPMSDALQIDGLKRIIDGPPHKVCWVGPGGTALVYPIKRGDVLNIVLSQEHRVGHHAVLKPKSVSVSRALEEFRAWDSRLLTLLRQCDSCVQWTLLRSDEVENWTDSSGRVVLIGDAAHAMPPYLGQGAAMALEDAVVLGELLALIDDLKDLPLAVKTFENLRKPRVEELRRLSLRMGAIYSMRDGVEQQKRDHAMQCGKGTGNPFFLLDPDITDFLFGYDVVEEAQKALHLTRSNLDLKKD